MKAIIDNRTRRANAHRMRRTPTRQIPGTCPILSDYWHAQSADS